MITKRGHKSSKVIEGLAALSKNGLRYLIPPYGIQSDAAAGLSVSYPAPNRT